MVTIAEALYRIDQIEIDDSGHQFSSRERQFMNLDTLRWIEDDKTFYYDAKKHDLVFMVYFAINSEG